MAPEVRVVPAYFSLGEPDLPTQVAALATAGVRQIHILPLFLLDGVHLRRDIPALVAELAQRWPAVEVRLESGLHDDPGLMELLARRLRCAADAAA
jgi:sirohydrochlorin ferrochelatase